MFKRQLPLAVIFFIFVCMIGLNYLSPMCFGDDYVYAFIWPSQSIFVPLPESVMRVCSFKDIVISQWSHYLTGNGRMIAHFIVQFFVWQGKVVFDFFNALIFITLILEIYWISNMGEVSFKNLKAGSLCWIFFVLWSFIAGFGQVYLWLAGSCNYVWMIVLLLSFLILYIRKYFNVEKIHFKSKFFTLSVFIWGVLAGWTNENTVCWFILILGFFLNVCKQKGQVEKWMFYGYVGLCLGYAFLILAPGNAVRASYYIGQSINIFSEDAMKNKLAIFGGVELFQILLWYFVLNAFKRLRSMRVDGKAAKVIMLAKIFCTISIMSNVIMLLSPEFHPRSGFPSLVFLTIGTSLLIRLQDILKIKFTDEYAKKFLLFVGSCYFLMTLFGTFWGMNTIHEYEKKVISEAEHYSSNNIQNILVIHKMPEISEAIEWMSGKHLMDYSLSDNENDWKNVAFARYYGLKGVRMVKGKVTNDGSSVNYEDKNNMYSSNE